MENAITSKYYQRGAVWEGKGEGANRFEAIKRV